MLKQDYEQPSPVKVLINIGALLDIPTGFNITGAQGETVLLGGLGAITAVVGRGNRYKSTILNYMMLSALERISSTVESSASTYDTEINIHETAIERFISRFPTLSSMSILGSGVWNITDKNTYSGNKWYEKTKEVILSKLDNAKKHTHDSPFNGRDKSTRLKILAPTFTIVDSFSEFSTDDVAKMQDDNELGESGANTIHMRQGAAKTRMLMDVPTLFGGANQFLLMTAHLNDAVQISAGPYAPPPTKKLNYLPAGDKVTGVTTKFFFLMNNCWYAKGLINLVTKDKTVEYPANADDDLVGDTDLNLVTLVQLRGKSGRSGFEISLVVSQTEGVLPELTEFHYIKTNDRFGINGKSPTAHTYALDLYPECNIGRTTIRGKIDSDPKLCRALNITSELCQMHEHWRFLRDKLCTPKQLYEDIKNLGYDWDMILSSTRGWWTLENDKHPLKFLSTMDLLNVRLGLYHPYWLEDDKRTIKK